MLIMNWALNHVRPPLSLTSVCVCVCVCVCMCTLNIICPAGAYDRKAFITLSQLLLPCLLYVWLLTPTHKLKSPPHNYMYSQDN